MIFSCWKMEKCISPLAPTPSRKLLLVAIKDATKRLEHEKEMYNSAGITTHLVTLGQRPALRIPHFSHVDFHDSRELVTTAVRALAVEKRIFHGDMKNEHVLWVSPMKYKPGRVVTIDMAQARQIKEDEDVEVNTLKNHHAQHVPPISRPHFEVSALDGIKMCFCFKFPEQGTVLAFETSKSVNASKRWVMRGGIEPPLV